MSAIIKHFIETNKGKLSIVNGSNFKMVKRNDGGKVMRPSINFGGFPDKYVVSEGDQMVLVAPAGSAQAIFELLNWAMAHYEKEVLNGKEEEN